MHRTKTRSDFVARATEAELDLLRGKCGAREAFGFYAGALGVGMSRQVIACARAEYARCAEKGGSSELSRHAGGGGTAGGTRVKYHT